MEENSNKAPKEQEPPKAPLSVYERSILLHGAIWFFLVLFGYYILRPIRGQISSTYGSTTLFYLFVVTFVVMLVAIPLYSVLVGKYHRRKLVPGIYAVAIGCLFLFWLAMRMLPERVQVYVAGGLFVWISVFGLFVVSFFWSVVGDMLSTTQGRRVFGYIAGGGTLGSLAGSFVVSQLVHRIGVANLLIIPAILLTLALLVYISMERSFSKLATGPSQIRSGKPTGGNPFAGFTAIVKSRYLFAISLFGLLLATCGTTVYFQQGEIVKATFANVEFDETQIENADQLNEEELVAARQKLQIEASKEASANYFANVDIAVSIATLIIQFFVVGWLMKNWGLGISLAILPLAYVFGISALAISPTIEVLVIVSVLGRSSEYGICNPAREVLFTAIEREDRYKAKSFIDTVVRRGGDSAVGGAYNVLRDPSGLFGFAMTTLSWLMVPIALAWVGLAFFIGHENKLILARKAEQPNEKDNPT